MAQSLQQILEEDIDDLDLGLNFTFERNIMGKDVLIELIPGGKNIPVTNQNKKEYVKAYAYWIMSLEIKE